MIKIHKKVVVDKNGNPTEVIIPWNEYNEMEELLGLDLDKSAIEDLKQAQKDRTSRKKAAYLELDTI
jgi:PHD/YefM family antitoxin component YafN of YafNO toxin-antitoxin module